MSELYLFVKRCQWRSTAAVLFFVFGLFVQVSWGQPVHEGDVFFSSQAEIDAWSPAYTTITGSLAIYGGDITDLTALQNVDSVGGSLQVASTALTNLHGLEGIHTFTFVYITSNPQLINLVGLDSLHTINSNLTLSYHLSLLNLTGLESLTNVGNLIEIYGNVALTNLTGLTGLREIHGNFNLQQNPAFASLSGLDSLEQINSIMTIQADDQLVDFTGMGKLEYAQELRISSNATLLSLSGLNSLHSIHNLRISDNPQLLHLESLDQLTEITGLLDISNNNSLTSLNGLHHVEQIDGELYISQNNSLADVSGLAALDSVGQNVGFYYNGGLTTLSGLDSLVSIGGNLSVVWNDGLTTLAGLDQLQTVGNALFIQNNHQLSECCAIYDLINTEGAVGTGIYIYDNDLGCDSPAQVCDPDGDYDNDGYTIEAGDCDDDNAMINPAVAELCGNGIDDNCNGTVDEQYLSLLILTDALNSPTCAYGNDGAINIHVTGGTLPYAYSWSNGSTTEDISSVYAGEYTVTVIDGQNRCNTKSFSIAQPVGMNLTFTTNYVTCYGQSNGSATVHVEGGASNYTYLWTNGATTKKINSVSSGYYFVTVTDANGCEVNGGVYVYEPGPFFISNVEIYPAGNNYMLIVNPYEGTAPYKYRRSKTNGGWTPWQSSNVFDNVPAGNYVIQAKDNNNCDASYSLTVPWPGQHPFPETPGFIPQTLDEQLFVNPVIFENEIDHELDSAELSTGQLILFPNPAMDQITILQDAYAGKPVQVTIINNLGIVLLHQKADAMPGDGIHVDLSDFPGGLYFLNLQAEGMKSETKYFVKVK